MTHNIYLIRQLSFSKLPNRATRIEGVRSPECDVVKIGITKDIEKRLSSLKANNGSLCRVEAIIGFRDRNTALKFEQQLHQELTDSPAPSYNREWFTADAACAAWLKFGARMDAVAYCGSHHLRTFQKS